MKYLPRKFNLICFFFAIVNLSKFIKAMSVKISVQQSLTGDYIFGGTGTNADGISAGGTTGGAACAGGAGSGVADGDTGAGGAAGDADAGGVATGAAGGKGKPNNSKNIGNKHGRASTIYIFHFFKERKILNALSLLLDLK